MNLKKLVDAVKVEEDYVDSAFGHQGEAPFGWDVQLTLFKIEDQNPFKELDVDTAIDIDDIMGIDGEIDMEFPYCDDSDNEWNLVRLEDGLVYLARFTV